MARQSRPTAGKGPVPVLLTRPEAQSQRLAEELRQRFGARLHPILTPLLHPQLTKAPLPPGEFSAVIFTAETAVVAAAALRRAGRTLPALAFCVGAQTAEAARREGFRAQSADGDADDLLAMILADPPTGPLLYLHGKETRGNLAERLNSARLETVSAVVYAQLPRPLSPAARAALQGDERVIAPLYSPRTAALLAAELSAQPKAPLCVVAMSAAVADAAMPMTPARMLIAARPNGEAMLAGIGQLLD